MVIKINQEILNEKYNEILYESLTNGHVLPFLLLDYVVNVPNRYGIRRDVLKKQSIEAREKCDEEAYARDKKEYSIYKENRNKQTRDKLIREFHEEEFNEWLKIFPQYEILIEKGG